MSILTSSSACLFNIQSQGSLVSQSVFKKPSMPRKTIQTPDESYSRLSQPLKKIKNDCSLAVLVQPKQQETKPRPGKLTLEDVFDTPSQSKLICKDLFLDECADEGSSLSFISSCTSLDSLEEFTAIEPNKVNNCAMVCEPTRDIATDSLVMKDDIMNQLNNLLSSQMLNLSQPCTFQPAEFLQTLQWEEQDLLRNATQPLTYIDPINISFMKLNEYVQQGADNNEGYPDFNLFVKNTPMKGLEAKRNKSESEDGDYFDFYVAGTASVERESTTYDALEVSDKSLKGGSPTYGGIFDMSDEERTSDKSVKSSFENSKKQGKKIKKAKKEKPVKPQVERVRKEKNQISSQEIMQNIKEVPVSVDSLATLPMLSFESERETRVVVKSVWDPEAISAEELEAYFEQLTHLTESTITDQEGAIKLLKSFGMNIPLVLEIVSQNKQLYKETFRVKVRRLRRNGAI